MFMYLLSLYFFFPFFSFHSLTSLPPSLPLPLLSSLSPSPPSFLPLLYPPPSPPPSLLPSPLVMMYNQLIQTQDYTFDDSLIPSLNIPDMVAPPPLPPKKRRRKVERDRKTERERGRDIGTWFPCLLIKIFRWNSPYSRTILAGIQHLLLM